MWQRLGLTGNGQKRTDDLAARVVALLSDALADQDRVTVVVVGEQPQALAAAVRQARPAWRVVDLDGDADALHVELILLTPVDALIDDGPLEGRLRRFRTPAVPRASRRPVRGARCGVRTGQLTRRAGRLPRRCGRAADEVGAQGRPAIDCREQPARRPPPRHGVGDRPRPGGLAQPRRRPGQAERTADQRLPAGLGPAASGAGDPPDGAASAAKHYTEGPVRRQPRVDGRIEKTRLFLREYRDILVKIEQLVMTDRAIVVDSFRHHRRHYLISRSVVDVAPRFGIPQRRVLHAPEELRGTYLHLDNEVPGALWACADRDAVAGVELAGGAGDRP